MQHVCHADFVALLDVLFVFECSDRHDVQSVIIRVLALRVNSVELIKDMNSGLVSIHDRHIQIHQD